jgi:DNA polymerase-1
MEQMRKIAAEQGYVETLYGRRLYLPEINSRNYNRRQYAERTAINAPMQGSAADLIKLAMIEVDNWLHKEAPDTLMILQVHDELVLEVPEDKLEITEAKIVELMIGVADLRVPLEVDTGIGDNWKQAH